MTTPAAPAPPDEILPSAAALAGLRQRARLLRRRAGRRPPREAGGVKLSRQRGRGMEFDEVRCYQPGDDVRNIDWRVTARRSLAHTKVFREERERPLHLLVDLRRNMFFGSRRLKSRVACDLAALLAWAACDSGDRVGGLLFGAASSAHLRNRRGHHGVLRLIHALRTIAGELLQPDSSAQRLPSMFDALRRVARPGSDLVVISDFSDLAEEPVAERQLFELSRHCNLHLVAVRDPLELQLPPPGHYTVIDGKQRRMIDTGDRALRHRFETRAAADAEHLTRLARQLGARLTRAATDSDPATALSVP